MATHISTWWGLLSQKFWRNSLYSSCTLFNTPRPQIGPQYCPSVLGLDWTSIGLIIPVLGLYLQCLPSLFLQLSICLISAMDDFQIVGLCSFMDIVDQCKVPSLEQNTLFLHDDLMRMIRVYVRPSWELRFKWNGFKLHRAESGKHTSWNSVDLVASQTLK